MIEKIIGQLTNSSLQNGVIEKEDEEIYRYGILHIGITIVYIIAYIFIGVITGNLLLLACYLLAFTPLRIYAGGYHMKRRGTCFTVTTMIVFLTSLFLKSGALFYHTTGWHLTALASYLIIVVLAPVDTKNKPFDEAEVKMYRKISMMILHIEMALYFGIVSLGYQKWGAIFLMSMVQTALLLILGKWDKRR